MEREIKNTDKSDKKQFVDWVVRKAAQSGVYIPDPERSEDDN